MDEQQEELETLEAIYMEDFHLLHDSAPFQFLLKIPSTEETEQGCPNKALNLEVELPEDYPQVLPTFTIQNHKDAANAIPDSNLSSLQTKLQEMGKENIGEQMIFVLSSFAKEWLDDYHEEELQQKELEEQKKQEELERAVAEAEAIKLKRREGTPVTKESFTKWLQAFEKENEHCNIEKQKLEEKPTGKALFERGGVIEEVLS